MVSWTMILHGRLFNENTQSPTTKTEGGLGAILSCFPFQTHDSICYWNGIAHFWSRTNQFIFLGNFMYFLDFVPTYAIRNLLLPVKHWFVLQALLQHEELANMQGGLQRITCLAPFWWHVLHSGVLYPLRFDLVQSLCLIALKSRQMRVLSCVVQPG